MKLSCARYAIQCFGALQEEHAEIVGALGMSPMMCHVRQKNTDSNNVWSCFEVGLDEDSGAFWGKFEENRGEKIAQVLIVVDIENIDSIEFEIYEHQPVEK